MVKASHDAAVQAGGPLTVLVTGGLGFVGSAIVRALQQQHAAWSLWILDRADARLGRAERTGQGHDAAHEDRGEDLLRDCRYGYIQADITKPDEVEHAFAQVHPDVVIHTAGVVPPLSERYGRRLEALVKSVNVKGTQHVVAAAAQHGCRALVYTSSCCAVTDDLGGTFANIDETWPTADRSLMYGESKTAAEKIVLAANATRGDGGDGGDGAPVDEVGDRGSLTTPGALSTCVLRPSVIFGEGDRQLVPPIHACIAKRETCFRIGHAWNLWDTVYVGNVADAHVLAVENLLDAHGPHRAAGEVFFIQNNEPISFRDFSLAVWKEFGHVPPARDIPIPQALAWALGLLAELATRLSGTTTTLSRGSVLDACAMRYASGDKARRVLGYRPRVGLEEGLKRSCAEYARRLRRTGGDRKC